MSGNEPRPLLLVVDDDTEVCALIAEVLRQRGYEVVQSTSGDGALRRMEGTSRPVLLITDFNLGNGMNGLELARTVRRLWPATPILLVSGECPPPPLPPGQPFLSKPFRTAELLDRVAELAARIPVLGPVLN